MTAVPGLAISDRNRDGLADNRSVFAATAVWGNNPNGGDRVGDDSAAITPALSLPGKNKAFGLKT
jgi:hypothetical protein